MTVQVEDIRSLRQEINELRAQQTRLSYIVEGAHGENGMQDVVKEIAVTLASLDRVLRLIMYLAVPLSLISLFMSFIAIILAVIALNQIR